MKREAGISAALTDSKGLWMGTAINSPGASSGAHHHGANESGIYILRGRVRFRWGEHLEHVVDTEPGDFIFVPPYEVHLEENLDPENEAELLLARAPEVIIEVYGEAQWSAERLKNELNVWASLQSIPAVRNKRVHILVDDRLAVPGPRVGEAAQRLAELIHPK